MADNIVYRSETGHEVSVDLTRLRWDKKTLRWKFYSMVDEKWLDIRKEDLTRFRFNNGLTLFDIQGEL